MTQKTLWIDVEKKMPDHNEWVLVLADKKQLDSDRDEYIFIARAGKCIFFLDDCIWESLNGNYYYQSIILGWMDIPFWRKEEIKAKEPFKSRFEILDIR